MNVTWVMGRGGVVGSRNCMDTGDFWNRKWSRLKVWEIMKKKDRAVGGKGQVQKRTTEPQESLKTELKSLSHLPHLGPLRPRKGAACLKSPVNSDNQLSGIFRICEAGVKDEETTLLPRECSNCPHSCPQRESTSLTPLSTSLPAAPVPSPRLPGPVTPWGP